MSDPEIVEKKAKAHAVKHAHDHAFQAAMSDLRVARDFLEHHLPEAVKKQIDLNTLTLHPTTFIDPELRSLISDVLYSVQFNGQNNQALIYVAVDHQSTPDKLMPFRMIQYTMRVLEHYIEQHRPKTPLPVVIPLVFFNHHKPYPYSTSVFDLFGEHKALAKQWMFDEFKLIDLNQIPDEELRQHQWSGLLELLFKHITARDIMRYLEQLSDLVDHLVQSKADRYLLAMIKYLIEKSEINDRNQFYHWVHNHLSPPLEEQAMTLAEQLRTEGIQQGMQQGIQQGMQQGIQQGIQQGELQGEQKLLIKQLRRRFPELNPDYEIQVKNARTEELLLWSERILDAKNIEEVFN